MNADDITKQLEEGRAARRERVRAALTVEERHAKREITQPKRKVKGPRPKQFSWRKVEAISREIDMGVRDCRADMPEIPEHDVVHDIAWSIIHCHFDEHAETLRQVCNRYSVDYEVIAERKARS